MVLGGDDFVGIIKFLIDRGGSDPNQLALAQSREERERGDCRHMGARMTPLHLSVLRRRNLVFDYLCRHPKVDVMKKDENGKTAKELALEMGNNRAFKRLREEERRRKKK